MLLGDVSVNGIPLSDVLNVFGMSPDDLDSDIHSSLDAAHVVYCPDVLWSRLCEDASRSGVSVDALLLCALHNYDAVFRMVDDGES